MPLLLHPQRPASHARLARAHGCQALDGVLASPTASYRSVLAWRSGRPPVVLKLSIGAVIGRTRRALREEQIARAVIMTRLFDTIPPGDRARLGLDWCREPAGLAEVDRGHGWLLRQLPASVPTRTLIPAFSLVSRRGDEEPPLVDQIRRAGVRPEAFVIDRLLAPYVDALSFLLLEHGLQFEGHSQNVLLEVDEQMTLTGRMVLRDLSDTSVSIPLRLAKRRPFPGSTPTRFPRRAIPAGQDSDGFPLQLRSRLDLPRPRHRRALRPLGLRVADQPVAEPLLRGVRRRARAARLLTRWQRAVMKHLRVEPLFRDEPVGLATDEAIGWFLRHVDWRALGATPHSSLPALAEPVLVDVRLRRRRGSGTIGSRRRGVICTSTADIRRSSRQFVEARRQADNEQRLP